ncbi:hypothetical protein GFM01_30170 [Rhizobium laguerreae]|uniref:CDP-alcohol phosphatidyltransferase family protein n=1 Tax=Rhizobium laguerreae TaxID=1076926 RepID=UPI0014427FD2|nr:CDP-alcohol phosphatidyltransferase family protein [Rhizobium laguerreae]NKM21961.1 hypothetical protein [Rhizobium laguerreae]
MLRYLIDPANAITTSGLLFSAISLFMAVSDRLEIAMAAALWAVLADHLDGIVASRTRNRRPDFAKIGKSLDGFGDIIYGAVLPAVVIIQLSDKSVLSFSTATALLLAGAIRLSYFANFGRSEDGRFLGVPLSYDVPLLALAFLVKPLLPPELFQTMTNIGFLLLAGAHVASIRVPPPNGAMYAAISIFAISASSFLLMRGLSA